MCRCAAAVAVLHRCDKVLQLHIIKKGCKPAATQGNASARAAAFMAANTAAAGPRSKAGPLAAAAGAAGAGPAAQRQQQQSRSGVTANMPQSQSGSRAADDDGESGDAAGAGQLLLLMSPHRPLAPLRFAQLWRSKYWGCDCGACSLELLYGSSACGCHPRKLQRISGVDQQQEHVNMKVMLAVVTAYFGTVPSCMASMRMA